MAQHMCGAGKGHPSWWDAGEFNGNQLGGCPTCAQEEGRRKYELQENKRIMKEAFLEALHEYHGTVPIKQG